MRYIFIVKTKVRMALHIFCVEANFCTLAKRLPILLPSTYFCNLTATAYLAPGIVVACCDE